MYPVEFYEIIKKGCLTSAREIVPRLVKVLGLSAIDRKLGHISPASVLDVGCGEGWWLSVFKSHGCKVFGVDGPHVDTKRLAIEESEFMGLDLRELVKRRLGRLYDAALCLEVAEHLPPECADPLVAYLTDVAPIVVFSSAVPKQGGMNHINEKWPKYWWDKFIAHGWCGTGALRWEFWDNPNVELWYSQNIFIFAEPNAILRLPLLAELMLSPLAPAWPVIHPVLWNARIP